MYLFRCLNYIDGKSIAKANYHRLIILIYSFICKFVCSGFGHSISKSSNDYEKEISSDFLPDLIFLCYICRKNIQSKLYQLCDKCKIDSSLMGAVLLQELWNW